MAAYTTKTSRRNGIDLADDGSITWVGDGQTKGTDLYYSERRRQWVAVNHDTGEISYHDAIAAVTLADDSDGEEAMDADGGLNQAALAMDLDNEAGLWIVDVADLDSFDDGYVTVYFRTDSK